MNRESGQPQLHAQGNATLQPVLDKQFDPKSKFVDLPLVYHSEVQKVKVDIFTQRNPPRAGDSFSARLLRTKIRNRSFYTQKVRLA